LKDYAFLKTDSGQLTCGFGPFVEKTHPPESGTAFYVNDFALSDPRPWKWPSHSLMAPDLSSLRTSLNGVLPPRVEWNRPEREPFSGIFDRIKREIGAGVFLKSVPVLTERGTLLEGGWDALLHRVERLPAAFFAYGYRQGDRGFVGGTPELLLATHGGKLETMALAGTAEGAALERFAADPKEISEHELVADYLCIRLAEIGAVRREPRQTLSLGPLAHLLSTIHVDLKKDVPWNDLVRFLHPTPALGTLPRDGASLAKLQDDRDALGTPGWFGAPFGAWVDGTFHAVVAIRNVSWNGSEAFLSAGCGVIEASVFENEWQELGLKRAAVKRMLGL